ncbi:MAG: DUF1778 domain-containing protein [Rhizobiales bacterium]|nr:DUF1778 domain-containing protein [Hyphomicrobiales bacterium]
MNVVTASSTVDAKARATSKAARLEARITEDQKALLERAAMIAGRSLSDFVVSSAQEAAARTIRDHEMMSLSSRDSKTFVAAVLDAAEPGARLRKAAHRYKKATAR